MKPAPRTPTLVNLVGALPPGRARALVELLQQHEEQRIIIFAWVVCIISVK